MLLLTGQAAQLYISMPAQRRLHTLCEQLLRSAAAAPAVEGYTSQFALPNTGCLIDNQWRVTAEPPLQVDAWDGTPIAKISVAGKAEVDAAVSAARAAFKAWKNTAPLERTKIILRFADLVEENLEELAQIECLELGKPIEQARGGVAISLQTYRYYAGWTDKIMGELPPSGTPGFHTQVTEGLYIQLTVAWDPSLMVTTLFSLTLPLPPSLLHGR